MCLEDSQTFCPGEYCRARDLGKSAKRSVMQLLCASKCIGTSEDAAEQREQLSRFLGRETKVVDSLVMLQMERGWWLQRSGCSVNIQSMANVYSMRVA